MERLGALGFAVDVEAEAFFAAIGQPFVNRQAVALRLGNLLALLIEEQLVDHPFGRTTAKHPGDLTAFARAISQVLARHFIIDPQRDPAHSPIDFPLQLGSAAKDAMLDRLTVVFEPDQPGLGIDHFDRNLQHLMGRGADRQDWRIGPAAFFAQRRQHHIHDRLIVAQDALQRVIELARIVAIRTGDEFVVEAKPVEKLAQHRVVVMGKALILVERIGDPAQRMAQIGRQQALVWHIVGHLTQPVHVVAERHQPGRRPARQHFIGPPDQGGAQHFLKGADVREPRWAIAGLKQHRRTAGFPVRIPLEQLARFFKRPSLGNLCGGDQCVINHSARAFARMRRFCKRIGRA